MWFCTRQSAFRPQDPIQGSLHFSVMQAWVGGQSVFTTHSGRQLGGEPMYAGRHEQDAWLPAVTWHTEFDPQGDGVHGFTGWDGLSCTVLAVK